MLKKIFIGIILILLPFVIYVISPVLQETNDEAQLQDLLNRNSETREFVRDYESEKDINHNMRLDEELKYQGMPLLLQWDKRWGYEKYGDKMMAINGCGPTCMSMVLSYLLQDPNIHPYQLALFAYDNGYYNDGTSWSFMSACANHYGVRCDEISLSEKSIKECLQNNRPIICSVRKGTFTSTGHFIVLKEYRNGLIYVNDPNSRIKSERGYTFDELMPQIKNLWSFRV